MAGIVQYPILRFLVWNPTGRDCPDCIEAVLCRQGEQYSRSKQHRDAAACYAHLLALADDAHDVYTCGVALHNLAVAHLNRAHAEGEAAAPDGDKKAKHNADRRKQDAVQASLRFVSRAVRHFMAEGDELNRARCLKWLAAALCEQAEGSASGVADSEPSDSCDPDVAANHLHESWLLLERLKNGLVPSPEVYEEMHLVEEMIEALRGAYDVQPSASDTDKDGQGQKAPQSPQPRPLPGKAGSAMAARSVIRFPIVERVAAGAPILAESNLRGYAYVQDIMIENQPFRAVRTLNVGEGGLNLELGARFFLLAVRGDSMIGADINDLDYVLVVENVSLDSGIVVAELDGGLVVKRLAVVENIPVLESQNPDVGPIMFVSDGADSQTLARVERRYKTKADIRRNTRCDIRGRVVAVFRAAHW